MLIMKLIKNEIIKILNRKKTWVTCGAFILLIGLIAFATYKQASAAKQWNSPEYRIQQDKNQIEYLKQSSKEANAKEQIAQLEADIAEQEKIKSGEKKFDWKAQVKQETEAMKKSLEDPMNKDKESIKAQIKLNEYLLNHNIEPDKYNIEPSARVFAGTLFEILGIMFLLVGIMVFGVDMVSGEFTPPTAKFLLAQPVTRGKVLFSKFAALFITSVCLIIPIELIAFVVMGLVFGFGDMNYPIIVGGKYVYDLSQAANMGQKAMIMAAGSAHLIASSQYLVRALELELVFILVSTAFTFLISTVLRNSMVSMAVGIVIVIATQILEQIPYTSKYMIYAFTTYGKFTRVLDGTISLGFNNPGVTMGFIAIIFTAWSVACYAISHIYFTKRDMLI